MTKTDVENDKVENLNTYFLFHSQMVQINGKNVSMKIFLILKIEPFTIVRYFSIDLKIIHSINNCHLR